MNRTEFLIRDPGRTRRAAVLDIIGGDSNMAKYRYLTLALIGCSLSTLGSTFSGHVVDGGTPPRPVANATVTVRSVPPVEAYTDSTGYFSLTLTTEVARPKTDHHLRPIGFSNGKLSVFSDGTRKLRFSLFSLDGRKIMNLHHSELEAGSHFLSLLQLIPHRIPAGVYLMFAELENETAAASLLLTKSPWPVAGESRSAIIRERHGFLKTRSSETDLSIRRIGYEPKSIPLPSKGRDLGEIVLRVTAAEALIARKTDSILALMTLDEKAGQMVQAQINFTNTHPGRLTDEQIASMAIGSVFNGGSDESALGQPNTPDAWSTAIDRVQNAVMTSSRLRIPILYGQDCVHGVGEIDGCTVFPHNIGLGCTYDSALIAKVGRITAEECAGIGIRFNYWPCIASVRNERWGRTYEGFGETPEINTLLGTAYIRGLQGDGDMAKTSSVAACAKHFLGDGGTIDGINNGELNVSETTVRAVHLPPYAAAVRELVATVMPSYHSWIRGDGSWPQTLDRHALTSILKTELGFDGFCISDWDAIARACESYKPDCVARAINAGLDMAMIVGDWNCGEFINSVKECVGNQTIPISRIDDAVRRILRIKLRFGLFEHPYSDAALRSRIGSSENRSVARECVRKSLVLLKNEDGALPLKKEERIAVVGPWANSLGAQCGGWTISWQGSTEHGGIAGLTILEGLRQSCGTVTFSEDGSGIADADKIVVVIGENPYAEQWGDCEIPDLSECPNAFLIEKCHGSGKPVVLVMITGRPMVIDTEIGWCKAVVAAWLPGGEGGGVADLLFGEYDFTGRLTHCWPSSASQIPINSGPDYADEQKGSGGTPLFPYGFGLKYAR